ncbi:MAG TPA: hypothetical protein VIC85_10390 [Ktedonobacterales bacterium]|jgi:hypothetical protein
MIIALAGRRIDAPDASVPRFPLASVPTVRERMRDLLVDRGARGVVCSAACGADLLALEVAGALGLRRRIVLPFDQEAFRAASVVDRPGDWGPVYDRVRDEVEARGDLRVLQTPPPRHAGYVRVVTAILDEAITLASAAAHTGGVADQDGPGERVLAVAVWDGTPRGPDDLTAAFIAGARERALPVVQVPTL